MRLSLEFNGFDLTRLAARVKNNVQHETNDYLYNVRDTRQIKSLGVYSINKVTLVKNEL